MRKVLVTGATGFTGRYVVRLLRTRGYEVTCFVRESSDRSVVNLPGVRFAIGNIDAPETLQKALKGQDALVNTAYLASGSDTSGKRATGIINACRESRVRRVVFIGSTGIFTTMDAVAKKSKLAAEKAIFDSGLDYTLLRPTMIYGAVGDRNLIRLVRLLRRSPVLLVPGDGKRLQQPLHVEDLTKAIVDCLGLSQTIGRTYNLSGAAPVSFNEIVRQTCSALGVKRFILHLPLGPALWVARLLMRIQKRTWIKEERLLRLNEDKNVDHSEASRDFGFSPRSFAQGIQQEVRQLEKEPGLPATSHA